jgi:hypothetical protein
MKGAGVIVFIVSSAKSPIRRVTLGLLLCNPSIAFEESNKLVRDAGSANADVVKSWLHSSMLIGWLPIKAIRLYCSTSLPGGRGPCFQVMVDRNVFVCTL